MKLILANNQSAKFTDFYRQLSSESTQGFDYASYRQLVFFINTDAPISVYSLQTKKYLSDYDGVYINNYVNTVELAVSVATSCEFLGVPFVNTELANAPSLSKLSSYAKLAAAKLPVPPTIAGVRQALLSLEPAMYKNMFPAVLKRADADRGIDNFKVDDYQTVQTLLAASDNRDSPWLLQKYIENDGYYVINYYSGQPKFCIFRSLAARADGNALKAHMYKPKGGANAELIEIANVPAVLLQTATKAMAVMQRQIGSIDCLFNATTQQVHILEVNFNPQLVTIETFSDIRKQAFTNFIDADI